MSIKRIISLHVWRSAKGGHLGRLALRSISDVTGSITVQKDWCEAQMIIMSLIKVFIPRHTERVP